MNTLSIKEVDSGREVSVFLRVPWAIYKGDPFWVPPLLSEQRRMLNRKLNPIFNHCTYCAWVAYEAGVPAGRILAYIDKSYNNYHKINAGFFGFFECVDRQETADLLFSTAYRWLEQNGMETMCGPMNFSIGNECGVQLDAFDTMPYVQMNHTPPYYRPLFEQAGFSKAHDLYAYRLMMEEALHHEVIPRLKKIADKIMLQQDLVFRPVNMKKYKEELESINTIFNEALKHNWGFSPSSMEEVLFTADALKMIADPDIILFAEHEHNVVGCSISMPDINQALRHINGKLFPFGWIRFLYYKRKIDRARVYLLGIVEESRFRGLDAAFYLMSFINGFKHGYKEAELSWVSEDNVSMISIIEKIGATRYKTYRMFEKQIS